MPVTCSALRLKMMEKYTHRSLETFMRITCTERFYNRQAWSRFYPVQILVIIVLANSLGVGWHINVASTRSVRFTRLEECCINWTY